MQFVQFAPFAQLFEGVLALCFGVGAGGQSEGPERVPEVFAELDEGVVGAYVGELAFYRGVLGGVSRGSGHWRREVGSHVTLGLGSR